MSALTIALIVFVCVFASALLGGSLRNVMPKDHLGEDSLRAVTLGTGMIATLAALVLGLLISSAKDNFDRLDDEFTQIATKVVLLDRTLAQYGPETKEARDIIHRLFASAIDLIFSEGGSRVSKSTTPERLGGMEQWQAKIRELVPRNDAQHLLQSRALELGNDLAQMRLLAVEKGEGALPTPFMVVLVLWLAMIFTGFGLLTANNSTVVATMFICALSVSGAVFLIEELYRPLAGLIKISSAPMLNALAYLGQ